MSTSRSHRRAATRARVDRERQDLAVAFADAMRCEPRFMATDGTAEVWMRGSVVFALPAVCEDYAPALKEVIARRRATVLSADGCPCGARPRLAGSPPIVAVLHESDCVAGDEHAFRIFAETQGEK